MQAAVAAASQTVLDHYLPDQAATVDAEYAAYIGPLTGNVSGGVALGQAAANDIIALRTGDGLNNTAVPSYGSNGAILPGQWQLQPGQKVQTPWYATMRPFLLEEPNQFRAPPPPSLTSHTYARDLNETEAYGALNSTVRTPEQTAIAYFWVGFNVNQYNVTMQGVVNQHQMDIVDAAHLFAMGNIVTNDAGIACYDSKFFYQFWRPITAIQNADKDNNPDTTADPTWQALLGVPGHPEYPSQHGCFTSAFADTIAEALHTQHIDVVMPGGNDGTSALHTTQHFNTVNDIDRQVVDARVWLGFHFRNSVEQGEKVGNHVADWELDHLLQVCALRHDMPAVRRELAAHGGRDLGAEELDRAHASSACGIVPTLNWTRKRSWSKSSCWKRIFSTTCCGLPTKFAPRSVAAAS